MDILSVMPMKLTKIPVHLNFDPIIDLNSDAFHLVATLYGIFIYFFTAVC